MLSGVAAVLRAEPRKMWPMRHSHLSTFFPLNELQPFGAAELDGVGSLGGREVSDPFSSHFLSPQSNYPFLFGAVRKVPVCGVK